ncbi:unnamed protein product [Rotaria magnacalcarata]|uniref:Uncharacterized protein n=2 Tax=Rotaria magnacalcarata TaxID=392030 RepID=A0A8S2Q0U3_9BILA|nr:unnamed protein product [Rotaria magnacalcarata]
MLESFRWINEPRRLNRASSHDDENQRYEESEGRKVIVEAKQEDRQPDRDFHIQELRKTYELPEHAGRCKSRGLVRDFTSHIGNRSTNS